MSFGGDNRGNKAGADAKIVAAHFYQGLPYRRSLVITDGRTYTVQGHTIAARCTLSTEERVARARAGEVLVPKLQFSFDGCALSSRYIVRHLDALGVEAAIEGEIYWMNGRVVDKREWYTLDDLEMQPMKVSLVDLKKHVRALRAPRERFVQLTLPLFA